MTLENGLIWDRSENITKELLLGQYQARMVLKSGSFWNIFDKNTKSCLNKPLETKNPTYMKRVIIGQYQDRMVFKSGF